MFPEVEPHNDFIEFYSGDKESEPDVAFIWDLKNKIPV
jgi:hypothetical protein